jgi:hypothetical protein
MSSFFKPPSNSILKSPLGIAIAIAMEKTGTMKLKKFDLSSITDEATICLCAKRHSGKSFLIRDIMHKKRKIPCGMVLAPTDKMTEFYEKFIPSTFVHYEYSSALLSNLFMRQKDIIMRNNDRKSRRKKPIDTRAFLIMDDCLSSKAEWGKDPNIPEIFFNGRHMHILFFFSMQFPLGLSPALRGNFDYVFLLAEDFLSNQRRIYEHYAGMFPSFVMFRKVFMEVTSNYGCLVINNRVKSNNLLDKVFWYRADNPGSFTVGGERYIKYHQRHYNKDWFRKRKIFNVNDYVKQSRGMEVNVELEEEEED